MKPINLLAEMAPRSKRYLSDITVPWEPTWPLRDIARDVRNEIRAELGDPTALSPFCGFIWYNTQLSAMTFFEDLSV